MFQTGMTFDMMVADIGAPRREIYDTALEMIAYADQHGFDQIILPEHHFLEDGYNPVPALMATAAAAHTKNIAIVLGAIVLPLHDPVEVAETIAVCDLISNGRIHAVLVAGYAHKEFAAFRKSMHDRSKLMDHGVDLITRALAGERFMDGDREVFVRPLPQSKPPRVYVGGGVAASAIRAAKYNVGYWPMSDDTIPLYEAECRKRGREPGPVIRMASGVFIAEDPEKGWADIGPYVLHRARVYAANSRDFSESSSPFHGLNSMEAVRKSGVIRVLTPDECVDLAKTRPLTLMPLIAGLPPKIAWTSVELFATKVLPRLKSRRQ